ncbi:MAG TPA: T9SS type A sorting domain-containing protein [Acidobacteriota bacterium]|nr:T9SS type A sorting domain-containing protein [Acidobacteriota bacterium]
MAYKKLVLEYDDLIGSDAKSYRDFDVPMSTFYEWKRSLREEGGTVDTVLNQVVETITEPGVYAAFTTDASVDVEDEYGDALPYRFELSQNYPNPFNPATTIEYSLRKRGHVTIDVFNVLGQKVRTLVNREEPAGSYTITWNGTDTNGKSVATGLYFYRFQAGDHVETKKMLLLK